MNIISSEIEELKRLKNPPKRLFYRGNLELLKMPKVSIVGSRKMSPYTKELILNLAVKLKNRGVCVVSGGALGCDIIAHIGSMPSTIGVFASGLDTIYPKENSKIISEIYEKGLALSEYEDGVDIRPHRFLERNRIVVGLSQALVVAEADLKSGSLNSARVAVESGIGLFVFPHRMNQSRGTNELLGLGKARLIYDIDKFVDEFCESVNLNAQSETTKSDEMIEFIKNNSDFDAVFAKFGERIYEYELEGKIEIAGTEVKIL